MVLRITTSVRAFLDWEGKPSGCGLHYSMGEVPELHTRKREAHAPHILWMWRLPHALPPWCTLSSRTIRPHTLPSLSSLSLLHCQSNQKNILIVLKLWKIYQCNTFNILFISRPTLWFILFLLSFLPPYVFTYLSVISPRTNSGFVQAGLHPVTPSYSSFANWKLFHCYIPWHRSQGVSVWLDYSVWQLCTLFPEQSPAPD